VEEDISYFDAELLSMIKGKEPLYDDNETRKILSEVVENLQYIPSKGPKIGKKDLSKLLENSETVDIDGIIQREFK
jgi:hypothetical protein